MFGNTGIVLTDCDYSLLLTESCVVGDSGDLTAGFGVAGLLLDGKETTHHFMVTEVYAQQAGSWKLCTFSFTALVY